MDRLSKAAAAGVPLADYNVGQRVMTREGYPGVIEDIHEGPADLTTYIVILDNDMGGGEYAEGEIWPVSGPTTAGRIDASVEHTAADDYPELGSILSDRLPPEITSRVASKTAAVPLKCSGCGETYFTDGEGHGCEGSLHDHWTAADEVHEATLMPESPSVFVNQIVHEYYDGNCAECGHPLWKGFSHTHDEPLSVQQVAAHLASARSDSDDLDHPTSRSGEEPVSACPDCGGPLYSTTTPEQHERSFVHRTWKQQHPAWWKRFTGSHDEGDAVPFAEGHHALYLPPVPKGEQRASTSDLSPSQKAGYDEGFEHGKSGVTRDPSQPEDEDFRIGYDIGWAEGVLVYREPVNSWDIEDLGKDQTADLPPATLQTYSPPMLAAKGEPQMIAEGGAFSDFLRGDPQPNEGYGGVGRTYSYDWCRFRKMSHCHLPKELNEEASKQAGYAVWVPFDRGNCPRVKWVDQQACPTGEPGPNSGSGGFTDATVPWEQGGQRNGVPSNRWASKTALDATEPHEFLPDPERPGFCQCGVWRYAHPGEKPLQVAAAFEFTASWKDIQTKAKRIRSEGGVRLVAVNDNVMVAHVRGDNGVYETEIVSMPGKRNAASWHCGCKWSSYSWGRSGPWKRFEGRMCSHALALQYEAQSRGSHGREMTLDEKQPAWMDGKHVHRPGDYDKDKKRYSSLSSVVVMGKRFEWEDMAGGRFFHGTAADLKPGDVLTPGRAKNFPQSDSSIVSITSVWGTARHWAEEVAKKSGGVARVYEVEPIGDVDAHRVALTNHGQNFDLLEGRTGSARVVAIVPSIPGRGSALRPVYDPVEEPPVVALTAAMLSEGERYAAVREMLLSFGVERPVEVIKQARRQTTFWGRVRGQIRELLLDEDEGVKDADDEQPVPARDVVYPGWHPTRGLNLRDRKTGAKEASGTDLRAAARAMLEMARRNEPDTTTMLSALALTHGGTMFGLDFRFKSEASLLRKMQAEAHEFGGDAGRTAYNMSDTLRYTMLFPPGTYTGGAKAVLAELGNAGYRERSKNYWERGDAYNGLNVAMMTPKGHPFELQFHTPESAEVKESKVHAIYEKWRVESDPERKATYAFQMRDLFDTVQIPAGVLSIPVLKRQPMPDPAKAASLSDKVRYLRLHDLSGETTTLIRMHPDSRVEVLKDGDWVEDSAYGRYVFLGEPRSDEISEGEADEIQMGRTAAHDPFGVKTLIDEVDIDPALYEPKRKIPIEDIRPGDLVQPLYPKDSPFERADGVMHDPDSPWDISWGGPARAMLVKYPRYFGPHTPEGTEMVVYRPKAGAAAASLHYSAEPPPRRAICDGCEQVHEATYSHEGRFGEGPIYDVTCPVDGMTSYHTEEGLLPEHEASLSAEAYRGDGWTINGKPYRDGVWVEVEPDVWYRGAIHPEIPSRYVVKRDGEKWAWEAQVLTFIGAPHEDTGWQKPGAPKGTAKTLEQAQEKALASLTKDHEFFRQYEERERAKAEKAKTAMPVGPMPEGLRWIHGPVRLPGVPAQHMLKCKTAEGLDVGHLRWLTKDYKRPPGKAGEITYVFVQPEHRRRGIATLMLEKARQIDSRVHHSTVKTEDGAAWSQVAASLTKQADEDFDRKTLPLTALLARKADMEEVLASHRPSESPTEPIWVKVRHDLPGRYEIADGHHRVAEALRRGLTSIEADIDPFEDDEPLQPPFYDFGQHKTAAHLTVTADEDQCPHDASDSLPNGEGGYTCEDGHDWHPNDPAAQRYHGDGPDRGKIQPTKEGSKMDIADEFGSLFDDAMAAGPAPGHYTASLPAVEATEWGLEPSYNHSPGVTWAGPTAEHPGTGHFMTPGFHQQDDDPEAALPVTYGDEDDAEKTAQRLAAALAPSQPVESEEERGRRLLAYVDASLSGQAVDGPNPFAHLMAGQADNEIAAAAANHLATKQAVKTYSPIERQAIIDEGEDVKAGNLDRLDISGTHYEALEATAAASVPEDEDMTFLDGDPNLGDI